MTQFVFTNANGKKVTLVNPDTNFEDVTVDVSDVASKTSVDLKADVSYVDGKMVLGTAVNSTSGTSIDFTGIPSWVKKITVMFNGVSTNGSSNLLIQLGTNSGIENTGYLGSSGNTTGGAVTSNYTTGFGIRLYDSNTYVVQGSILIKNFSGNTFIADGVMGASTYAIVGTTAGSKTLSGTLNRIRITTVNGTDTFDAGQINLMYEG